MKSKLHTLDITDKFLSLKIMLSNQLWQDSCKILEEICRNLERFCIYTSSQTSLSFTCDILKKLRMYFLSKVTHLG